MTHLPVATYGVALNPNSFSAVAVRPLSAGTDWPPGGCRDRGSGSWHRIRAMDERVLVVAIGIIVIAVMAFVIFMWWLVMLS